MLRFVKNNWFVLLILLVGFILRIYKYDQLFMYGHDQDLTGWIVKDIVVDKHLRLIGQETSTYGIFIGGFFYYLQIPFYFLFGMDPIGVTFMGAILGVLYLIGIYLISSKLFSKNTALIAVLTSAFSFYFIFNDREIVPTQPVIFWSFALFWALSDIIRGNIKRGLLICAVLFSLVWHLNFALILPVPLVLIAFILSHKKINFPDLILPVIVFMILSIPLFYFEYRHSFLQTKALISSISSDQHDIISGWDKVVRTYHLISKNLYSIFLPSLKFPKYEQVMLVFVGIYIYLVYKLKEYRKIMALLLLWFIEYFLFFSLYSKRVSEYYLNGIQFIFVILFSLFVAEIVKNKKYNKFGYIILSLFVSVNIYRFMTIPINRSGYLERKSVVSEINKNAKLHQYPCVSISYITDPGYNLGYRYFFWREKMHVNNPSSGSPVYTIVFPLNDKLFPVNITFGAIGLIYPDFSRYTKDDVEESCSGANSNLTDPMLGFTK